MSEKPLFEHADEQEATYAPQQLPADGGGEATASAGGFVLPLAAAGSDLSGHAPGVQHAGGTGGVAGGAALAARDATITEASDDEAPATDQKA
jgi:hypothetical protein